MRHGCGAGPAQVVSRGNALAFDWCRCEGVKVAAVGGDADLVVTPEVGHTLNPVPVGFSSPPKRPGNGPNGAGRSQNAPGTRALQATMPLKRNRTPRQPSKFTAR